MEVPLYITTSFFFFLLLLFLRFSLELLILVITCLGRDLFSSSHKELCASWVSVSSPLLGTFSAIISQIFRLFLSSPSGTPLMWMSCYLMLSHRNSTCLHSFNILFSLCCSIWMSSTALSGHWSCLLLHFIFRWIPRAYFQFSYYTLQLYDFCSALSYLSLPKLSLCLSILPQVQWAFFNYSFELVFFFR